MKSIAQVLEETPVTAVHLHPRNPRRGDVAAIRESIDANGWYGAIVAQRATGYILAGNHRYRAALAQGATSLPVLWVDCDEDAALRILLADNRTGDLADYEREELTQLLRRLFETDKGLAGTGYSPADLASASDDVGNELDEADDQSQELTDQFHVLVECRSETDQRDLVTRLLAEGFACRALLG